MFLNRLVNNKNIRLKHSQSTLSAKPAPSFLFKSTLKHLFLQLLKKPSSLQKISFLIGTGSLLAVLAVIQSPGVVAASRLLDHAVPVFIVGLAAGYIVGGLGLAWGAILVPSLLLMDVNPTVAAQSSLLLQILVVPLGGLSHYRLGNVDKRIFTPLLITGILGAFLGAFTSARLPESWLKLLIGLTTLGMGLLVLSKSLLVNGGNGQEEYREVSMIHTGLIGVAAGFAAGAFGTGWGPIGVSALILAGAIPRQAIGSSLLARSFIAVAGSAAYFAVGIFQPNVLLPLLLGGGIAVVLGALSNKKLDSGFTKTVTGVAVLVLGLLTILKVIL